MKHPAAILVLSLAACNGSSGAIAPVTPKAAVAIAPTAEVIARPGEQMTYRISVHNVEVGDLVIVVGEPSTLDGASVIAVEMHTTSAKLLGWVRPIHDTLISWIDRSTGRPVAYKTTELASRNQDDIEDSETRFAPGRFTVHVLRRGQALDEEQVVRDAAYDIPSMLTFLRGWDGEPGTQVTVDVMRSRNAWRANLVIAGFENVGTALGDLPSIRYDGWAVRILRDGTVDPKAARRAFSIWITDDADRVPARMSASTDYGEVDVQLQTYRAE